MRADYEESWVLCPIKILHKCETYSQARLNLKKAEANSNLYTDEDMLSERKRKSKIQVLPGESEDDDDGIVKTKWKKRYKIKKNIPEYPNFQCSETTTMKSPVSTSYNNNSQFVSGSNSALLNTPSIHYIKNFPSDTIRPGTPNSSSSTLTSVLNIDRSLLHQMQTTIAAISEQVVILNNKMNALLNSSQNCYDSNSASEFSLLGHLPLQTIEDFDSFE
ncbi:hypothetical protein FQA39_LY06421 [Lamprigera yunnana]|nr:hypothetical protein FQA39_LY06421 [Lamprigera yunnana]